jgi:hypothetical protein
LRTLWTFENQAKVDLFVAILQEADISYETLAKGKANSPNGEVVISVAEREYEQAKKLLMKYRKRRTTT